MSTVITGDSLGQLVANARSACHAGPVFNLIIEGRYPFSELDSSFLRPFEASAALWQATSPDPSLYITHGQFINRHGDGIAYLTSQLVMKPTGNRAVLSLIDMRDLIGSDDDVRPSFLTFQAGFASGRKDVVFATMYFRALEVSSFLPVNLAEAASILKRIRLEVPDVTSFELTVHAFKAYENLDSNLLTRSALDAAGGESIKEAVDSLDLKRIHAWLRSKMPDETKVELDALVLLRRAIEANAAYPAALSESLTEANLRLMDLATLRRRASHSDAIPETKKLANDSLEVALASLQRMPQWK